MFHASIEPDKKKEAPLSADFMTEAFHLRRAKIMECTRYEEFPTRASFLLGSHKEGQDNHFSYAKMTAGIGVYILRT